MMNVDRLNSDKLTMALVENVIYYPWTRTA